MRYKFRHHQWTEFIRDVYDDLLVAHISGCRCKLRSMSIASSYHMADTVSWKTESACLISLIRHSTVIWIGLPQLALLWLHGNPSPGSKARCSILQEPAVRRGQILPRPPQHFDWGSAFCIQRRKRGPCCPWQQRQPVRLPSIYSSSCSIVQFGTGRRRERVAHHRQKSSAPATPRPTHASPAAGSL